MASSYLTLPSPRRRATAIGLTILVHVALIWALFNLGPAREFVPFAESGSLSTFDVPAPAKPAPKRAQTVRQQQQRQRTDTAPPPPRPKVEIDFADVPGMIWMSRDQYAKTDIAKTGKLPPRAAPGAAQTADAGGGDDSPTAGRGPNGQALYAAEWYREPTDAELRTFLPDVPPDSWGKIACRMIPDYRVENCQTVGESPLGSGIATGMRRASWQFRVRPPRVGGQPKYGTWVVIHIYFSRRGPEVRR